MIKKLTIAIPTYKRTDVVVALIRNLLEAEIDNYVDIILIDDGPSENLKDKLNGLTDRIVFITHKENKGYSNTFCELFENCNTEYMLITADDDKIIPEQISQIIEYLNFNSFDFLSTRWLQNGRTYRGKDKCAPISFSEVDAASGHAPGLIYKVDSVIPLLPFLKGRLKKNCQATFFYPQLIVLYLLLIQQKKCYWIPNAPVVEGSSCDSNLVDFSGDTYYSISGRWKIILDFIDLFNELQQDYFSPDKKKIIQAIRIRYQQKIYKRIQVTIQQNNRYIWEEWVAGSVIYNISKPFRLLKYLFRWSKNWIVYNIAFKKAERYGLNTENI